MTHCHLLVHEDTGCMAQYEIVNENDPNLDEKCLPYYEDHVQVAGEQFRTTTPTQSPTIEKTKTETPTSVPTQSPTIAMDKSPLSRCSILVWPLVGALLGMITH